MCCFNNFPKTVALDARTTECIQMLMLNRMLQKGIEFMDFHDDCLAKPDENGNHYNANHTETLASLETIGTMLRIELSVAIEDAVSDFIMDEEHDYSNFTI